MLPKNISQAFFPIDCLIEHFGESYQTTVYIKETNAGDCLKFKSICPATRQDVIPPPTSVVLRVRCVSASEHTLKTAQL